MPIRIGPNEIDLPDISKVVICKDGEQNIVYESKQPFYIESTAGTCSLQLTKTSASGAINMWVASAPETVFTWAAGSTTYSYSLPKNEKLYFEGTTTTFAVDGTWTGSSDYNIGGDFMSLANYSTTATAKMFYEMFTGEEHLINAKNSTLSAKTVCNQAYAEMFYSCYYLRTPPAIRGTKFTSGTYQMESMFSECYELTVMPKLTIEEISEGTCFNMFNTCENLTWPTHALTIKVTTIPAAAFGSTFIACLKLDVPDEDALNTFKNVKAVGEEGFSACFGSCQGLKTAFKFENLETVSAMSFMSMYAMCYDLTKPFIPGHSTKLNLLNSCAGCFASLFDECSNLAMWPVFPYVEIDYDCYNNAFYGCDKLAVSENPTTGYSNQFMIGKGSSPEQVSMFEGVSGTRATDNGYGGTTYYTPNPIYNPA